ncbi:MAG: preprotein translocase subunit SecA [Deltaproteobacteria bacterium]|nr:preprotein translocase subunit SecA [Deltaproteobacteria bacterium]
MFSQVVKKIVGSKYERELKRLTPLVARVGAVEPEVKALTDEQLRLKTGEFKERLAKGASLDDLLGEAFAVVREAAWRTIKQRHFDCQVMGGIVLHEGKIAEMKTGEGKTLAATMPVYLNALTGRGVHVVTVNDYLARRDAEWMGSIYEFLGMTVGVIVADLEDEKRRQAYSSDVTYGTNNEFGFDYLRDNMKFSLEDFSQREFHYCIVDEVDSILIDEARTPLIISGPTQESTELYYQINRIIPKLRKEADYTVDEKARTAVLTEEGIARAEQALKVENLYDPDYLEILHHVNQALKAHTLFGRDVDYIVKSGEVIIVDEFTGRLMPGRRYSDGLHQALEAKEGVKIARENQTLASITFQNYFRMYEKLAGMTGTADTEAAEFAKTYKLDVAVIPTNEEMVRNDYPDVIYRTEREKFEAVINEIEELHAAGRPVLVGTISIEKSELLHKMLKRKGIPHAVLNAKHHEQEAEIVSQAGQPGTVTISTNMAGRGTDIVLGEDVAKRGGLHILGTERHESRRIDNQLRGRSGRQGDSGSSRFYLSLEDDLLRIFGSERVQGIMGRLGMGEGEPIEHKLISKAIESAQGKVEGHNFDIRKHLLEYDDVMNRQRDVIYRQRRNILTGENLKDEVWQMVEARVEPLIADFTDEKTYPEEWELNALDESFFELFGMRLNGTDAEDLTQDSLREMMLEKVRSAYKKREEDFGAETMRELERFILLQSVDNQWKDHLLSMDHLKEGIGLRGYGQRDPLREYQKEGYDMFMDLIERIQSESVSFLFHIQVNRGAELSRASQEPQEMQLSHGEAGAQATVRRDGKKIGRNEPCPCGSGKKYKKCCGRNA